MTPLEQILLISDQLLQFSGKLYEKSDWIATGSPLGVLLANVFVRSNVETLEREGKMVSFFKRLVVDSLTMMSDTTSAATFIQVLSNCAPLLSKITMETESSGVHPFLDFLVCSH